MLDETGHPIGDSAALETVVLASSVRRGKMIRLPKKTVDLPSTLSRDILAAMHRSDTPTRWSLASLLLILILFLPVLNVHAAGAPTDAETPDSPAIASPSSLPGTGYYYAVQPTDTLWDIAVAHGISVEALIAANTQVDPKRLQAGQTIFVPAQPAIVPRKPPPTPAPPPTPLPEATAAPDQEAGQTPVPADAFRPSRRRLTHLYLSQHRSTQPPPRPRPNRRRLSRRSLHLSPADGRLRSWN